MNKMTDKSSSRSLNVARGFLSAAEEVVKKDTLSVSYILLSFECPVSESGLLKNVVWDI